MEIISGIIPTPQKVLIYGPEGIGKAHWLHSSLRRYSSTQRAAPNT